HRRDAWRLERLPGDRLVLKRMRLAAPGEHAEEIQPDVAVRIDVIAREPGIAALDVDAELFVQLARERMLGWLAGFDLAAREFPVAGVDLARRTLRQQKAAVGALDDGRGDLNHFFG